MKVISPKCKLVCTERSCKMFCSQLVPCHLEIIEEGEF